MFETTKNAITTQKIITPTKNVKFSNKEDTVRLCHLKNWAMCGAFM